MTGLKLFFKMSSITHHNALRSTIPAISADHCWYQEGLFHLLLLPESGTSSSATSGEEKHPLTNLAAEPLLSSVVWVIFHPDCTL